MVFLTLMMNAAEMGYSTWLVLPSRGIREAHTFRSSSLFQLYQRCQRESICWKKKTRDEVEVQ